ncbi:endonuclease Q family protein [Candidatus Parcubacteria bacterium]|nr:endonuclease Q family protein [Patescibacteria group bacterium]MCG2693300.1 endonuclease Q family protein [Candidatus Parcubacteria bacterium]
MQIIADLHLHSKYSRATSPQMDIDGIFKWAKIKGINLVATGDYTHPEYFKELKEKLERVDNGFYKIKSTLSAEVSKRETKAGPSDELLVTSDTYFVPTAEISCIYSKGGKCRRLHICLITPTFEEVAEINSALTKIGNLHSDGRPILGLDAKKLAQIVLDISPDSLVICAHAWTPWFAIFGSKSGFDSMEECFEELTPKIYAVETGLSSDPAMNWRWSALDNLTLISNSDAHSPANLGREVNVLELQEMTYVNMLKAIRREDLKNNRMAYTIEFFPQEGKYHYDGHRLCNVSFSPEETKKRKGICPVCKRPLTLGVDYRVSELADRKEKVKKPAGQADYKSLVPLQEIIAESFNVGKNSKKVQAEYQSMIEKGKSEFNILLNLTVEELKKITIPKIMEAIKRVQEGNLIIKPGYDGEYGVVKIFSEQEQDKNKQETLF